MKKSIRFLLLIFVVSGLIVPANPQENRSIMADAVVDEQYMNEYFMDQSITDEEYIKAYLYIYNEILAGSNKFTQEEFNDVIEYYLTNDDLSRNLYKKGPKSNEIIGSILRKTTVVNFRSFCYMTTSITGQPCCVDQTTPPGLCMLHTTCQNNQCTPTQPTTTTTTPSGPTTTILPTTTQSLPSTTYISPTTTPPSTQEPTTTTLTTTTVSTTTSTTTTIAADCRPPYEPQKWNVEPVLSNNNCYNYGCDMITYTIAHPGKASGYPTSYPPNKPPQIQCSEYIKAAEADGLAYLGVDNNVCSGCTHEVALVMDLTPPYTDYHWYRKDNNGFWSHKYGPTQATDLDTAGQKISDPKTSERDFSKIGGSGVHDVFCGYFCVDKKKVVIQ